MKYRMTSNKSLSLRAVLPLAILVVLSIACDDVTSHNTAVSQPDNPAATPAASTSQPAATTPSVAPTEAKSSTKPDIQITEAPSKGAGPDEVKTIAGTASGVDIAECKVVVFARTDVWYVQPYIASSDTSINEDGTWRSDTHLGLQYAAMLVKKAYNPPSKTRKLPDVGGQVLAIALATAK